MLPWPGFLTLLLCMINKVELNSDEVGPEIWKEIGPHKEQTLHSLNYPSCCEPVTYIISVERLRPNEKGYLRMTFDDLDIPFNSKFHISIGPEQVSRLYPSQPTLEGVTWSRPVISPMTSYIRMDFTPSPTEGDVFVGFKAVYWAVFSPPKNWKIDKPYTNCPLPRETYRGGKIAMEPKHLLSKRDQAISYVYDCVYQLKLPRDSNVQLFVRVTSLLLQGGELEILKGIHSESNTLKKYLSLVNGTEEKELGVLNQPAGGFTSDEGFYMRIKMPLNKGRFHFIYGVYAPVVDLEQKDCDIKLYGVVQTGFRCVSDPWCLPMKYKCDGIEHCDDGSDEDIFLCEVIEDVVVGECTVEEKKCSDGSCVHYTDNCPDENCKGLEYWCPGDKKCVAQFATKNSCNPPCNTTFEKQCVDICVRKGQDCPLVDCPESYFSCGDGTCLTLQEVCNGKINCLETEADEDVWTCSQNLYLLKMMLRVAVVFIILPIICFAFWFYYFIKERMNSIRKRFSKRKRDQDETAMLDGNALSHMHSSKQYGSMASLPAETYCSRCNLYYDDDLSSSCSSSGLYLPASSNDGNSETCEMDNLSVNSLQKDIPGHNKIAETSLISPSVKNLPHLSPKASKSLHIGSKKEASRKEGNRKEGGKKEKKTRSRKTSSSRTDPDSDEDGTLTPRRQASLDKLIKTLQEQEHKFLKKQNPDDLEEEIPHRSSLDAGMFQVEGDDTSDYGYIIHENRVALTRSATLPRKQRYVAYDNRLNDSFEHLPDFFLPTAIGRLGEIPVTPCRTGESLIISNPGSRTDLILANPAPSLIPNGGLYHRPLSPRTSPRSKHSASFHHSNQISYHHSIPNHHPPLLHPVKSDTILTTGGAAKISLKRLSSGGSGHNENIYTSQRPPPPPYDEATRRHKYKFTFS